MHINVFLVTLMAASSMALPMIISPLPMAARDLAVADVAARSALGGTHASSGSFKREAEAEAKGGTHASSGSFKREADAKGGTHSSGGSFKRLASGGTHASGGIF